MLTSPNGMTEQQMEDRYGPTWRECTEAPLWSDVALRFATEAARDRMREVVATGQLDGGFVGRGVYEDRGREAGFVRSRGSYR